jgi:signal transduction histidine kinase
MNLRGLLHTLLTARWAAPLILGVVAATVFFNERSHHQTIELRDQRLAMIRAGATGMSVLQLLTEAESAQRGYLLTGHETYLSTYGEALAALPGRLEPTLKFLEGAGQAAAERASKARALIELKLSELATTIELAQSGKGEMALEVVRSGIGRDGMNSLREEMRAALEFAAERDTVLGAAIEKELLLRRLIINVLAVLSGIAGLAYGRRLLAESHAAQSARTTLEAEVAARTSDLRQLASYLQTVQEAERARLSRELHDEMGGLLTAAKFDLARMRNAKDPAQLAERLKQANRRLDEVVAIKRRIIEDLRPSSLQHLGLGKALELLCTDVSERLGLKIRFDVDTVALNDEAELTIYRLVQEALTNVQKYAHATSLAVTLKVHGDRLEITISDDGAGFDIQGTRVARHGLAGMRYRVESLDGQLTLESAPGRGTRVQASLPRQGLERKGSGGSRLI